MSDEFGATGGETGGSASSSSPTAVADHSESSPTAGIAQSESQAEGPEGPVPYQRFKQINDRYNSLKWAEGHDANTVAQYKAFFEWLDTDPVGAHGYVTDYLKRSGVLREPQQQAPQGNGSTAPGGRPQPDIVLDNGQRFYSAEAAERLVQWQSQQAEQRFNSRLAPIEQSMTVSAARQAAQDQLNEAETWPYYKEVEGDILREMQRDKRLSLEGAYRRVALPKIKELERKAILAEMKQKPEASTLNPGSISATEKKAASKMSFGDLLRREAAKRGGFRD